MAVVKYFIHTYVRMVLLVENGIYETRAPYL
jgi:hypothetical protein